MSSTQHSVQKKQSRPKERLEWSNMKTSDVARYRADLQDKKRELSVSLRRRWDIAPVSSPDSVEEVQLSEVRELEIDSLDRQVGLLREVEDALSRLSDGSFGACRLCDAKIMPTRLNAVPWAALCIDCQEHAEKARGTNGRLRSSAFTAMPAQSHSFRVPTCVRLQK